MKRIILLLLTTFAVALTFNSCIIDFYDDNDGFCVRGEGPVVSRELNMPFFRGIDLEVPAKVLITQGPTLRVRAEGYDNIVNAIERDVRNGIWEIEFNDCVRNIGELTIYVTMPEIASLRISGTGDIIGENFFTTDDIELIISGTGKIDLGLDADDIYARISGTGNIILEGDADELELESTGTGDFRAFQLKLNRADIEITGAGDAEVFVTNYLRVRITGTGDVLYRGNPRIDFNITGTGDLIDAN